MILAQAFLCVLRVLKFAKLSKDIDSHLKSGMFLKTCTVVHVSWGHHLSHIALLSFALEVLGPLFASFLFNTLFFKKDHLWACTVVRLPVISKSKRICQQCPLWESLSGEVCFVSVVAMWRAQETRCEAPLSDYYCQRFKQWEYWQLWGLLSRRTAGFSLEQCW